MKKIIFFSVAALFVLATAFTSLQSLPEGAFQRTDSGETEVLLFKDGYVMHTGFRDKSFLYSHGGAITRDGENIMLKMEFDTRDKSRVGKSVKLPITFSGDRLTLNGKEFSRVDDGSGDLAGNWRISGRKQGDNMGTINPGPRKTLKLLTGKRFQWAAINTETGEFFGTGGGTYVFNNGKYTENIEYFSRDSTRVGASLTFDGKVNDGKWEHSGLSSKGDPIFEIWSRENK